MTRDAFGLADNIETESFEYATDLTEGDVTASTETLGNIRLWDPAPTQEVFRAQQERFPFYRFVDVDVDRYTVGSDPEQATMVALRELDAGNIPDRSWTNRHLVYTHGYGPVAITANLQSDGEPSLPRLGDPAHRRAGRGDAARRLLRRGHDGLRRGRHQGGGAGGRLRHRDRADPLRGRRRRRRCRASCARARSRCGSATGTCSSRVSSPTSHACSTSATCSERVRTAAPFLRFDSDPYPVLVGRSHPLGDRCATPRPIGTRTHSR